ncbi:MAG: hypothetical protein E7376_03115 [Clostridiales bacterium]|nr:hypothetical protein [Clostridiales bacterium]
MHKQTKTLKFIFFILLLIPIVLFAVGIIQTFVLKSKQNELNALNQSIIVSEQQQTELEKELEYKQSDEYKNEYYKYENGYGKPGDIEIVVE